MYTSLSMIYTDCTSMMYSSPYILQCITSASHTDDSGIGKNKTVEKCVILRFGMIFMNNYIIIT